MVRNGRRLHGNGRVDGEEWTDQLVFPCPEVGEACKSPHWANEQGCVRAVEGSACCRWGGGDEPQRLSEDSTMPGRRQPRQPYKACSALELRHPPDGRAVPALSTGSTVRGSRGPEGSKGPIERSDCAASMPAMDWRRACRCA